jgi:phospholipid-translocating ATPase
MQADKVTLISPPLADALSSNPTSSEPLLNGATHAEQRQHVLAFFRALALCHGVLAAEDPSASTDSLVVDGGERRIINYKAESPDEAALVSAARDMGFPFLGKSKSNSSPHDILEIQVCGGTEQYELLRVIEFDSTRKRMSVIVRCPDRRIEVYCKGADSVVYERLDPNVRGQREGEEGGVRERTKGDMEKFANEGLRTLCIAHRVISEDEFREWEREYEGVSFPSLYRSSRDTHVFFFFSFS